MDVEGAHSAQVVLMQGYHQQPGGAAAPAVVLHTTVNMVAEPPRDHIIWSLCCFVYSNPFCLRLVALIFSIKARDRKVLGDFQGAQRYGSTARTINIVSTVLFCIIIVISLICIIVSHIRYYNSYSYRN